MLYHRYEIDDDGTILDARIVPPTSQNQLAIEEDLRAVVERYLDLARRRAALRCEQAIRNHDPCISCATHFLELTVDRGLTRSPPPSLVIGVGNALRGDDGAGLEVVRRARALATPAATRRRRSGAASTRASAGLLELWEGAGAVVLVDAIRSGAGPRDGPALRRARAAAAGAAARAPPPRTRSAWREAIELAPGARAAAAPGRRLRGQGACFDAGRGLSAALIE